jgi:hypothetical protein
MAQGQGEYIIKITLDKGQAVAEVNGMKVALSQLDKGLNKTTSATKKNVKANQDLISSSGLAGATLVETGRFISDLPFGITAVTNNLSQLSTLFVTLISKTEGAGNAFKLLGKQLTGPLGFILAFQVVIALLQAYQKEIIGFIKGTDQANEATKKLTKSVDDLTESLEENNKAFKETGEVEENIIGLQTALAKLSSDNVRTQIRGRAEVKARVQTLKELGKQIDETKLSEEGYLETLLQQNETAGDVAKALEKRRIDIIVAGILGTMTPLELAQAQLDLFIDTQKESAVLEEAYLESEEYRTLVAKRDFLRQRAQIEAFESNLTPEGLAPIGDAELKAEVRLTGFIDDEARKRAELRKLSGEDIINLFDELTQGIQTAADAAFEADISREERKTALINNQLNERLRNENLSASEKESINNQIERNEFNLQKKRDKIAERAFKVQKALNIASALSETYRTGVLAYGSQLIIGDPTSPVRAQISQAIALAAGLANVAMIARQKFVPSSLNAGGGAAGSGGAGSGRTIEAPDFNVVGASETSQLAQTVAGQQAKPVKAFVVGKDISTQQELDRNITTTASIG